MKMEDVYTIKVKSKPDTRNLYPSERRYSASTVSGLAWVHIALAATSLLLACLALVNPHSDNTRTNINHTQQNNIENSSFIDLTTDLLGYDLTESYNETNGSEVTGSTVKNNACYVLVIAPSLLTIFALSAGIASIMASVKWYVDNNITWLFAMSVLSTVFSMISFLMVAVWFVKTSETDISDFYKDKLPFDDIIIVKHIDVIDRNESHMVIKKAHAQEQSDSNIFTNRVLSINILVAAFLELLWSVLSVKISYKGMRNHYRDNEHEPKGNVISVVTKIKGNNTKSFPRNGQILPPKSTMIDHYPNEKIKKVILAQGDTGFYMKSPNKNVKQITETSSEFYKERMMNFLNRCASLEGVSNPETSTASEQSETVTVNTSQAATIVQVNQRKTEKDPVTSVSWGDTPDHTVYNQNTLNLDKIFNFVKKTDALNLEEKQNEELCDNIK